MERMHVICPDCGTEYHIVAKPIEKIEKGNICCFSCDASLFEYDGCASYYPFVITPNSLQNIGGLETGEDPGIAP